MMLLACNIYFAYIYCSSIYSIIFYIRVGKYYSPTIAEGKTLVLVFCNSVESMHCYKILGQKFCLLQQQVNSTLEMLILLPTVKCYPCKLLTMFYIYTADIQVIRVTRWIVLQFLPKSLYKLEFFEGIVKSGETIYHISGMIFKAALKQFCMFLCQSVGQYISVSNICETANICQARSKYKMVDILF